ncbi:hypothetical protein LJ737_00140 [Hymenobacter sp. 15J16-1T3B]|uniref:beta strand repeat-containing protein n=1 Tax=Hymenobacter sp. 15J16-1T3B TaxID=2886941 RepID=UPI001D0FE075|nr:hypothetical protein [Hymenobacter sp. 15J16-1T3B]MCC3155625.1 hypothetical protein [Hymenobacter sp. 15J16-1T3B]
MQQRYQHIASSFRPWLAGLGLLLLTPLAARAQSGSVGIGTTTPDNSAALEVRSDSKGLLLPRLTQQQRNAIQAPATGLLIYQTDNAPGVYQFNGTAWLPVSGAADNLGNHTATQNLNLGTNQLVGNGGTAGLSISNAGGMGIGTTSPGGRLQVNTNTGAEVKAIETLSSNSRYTDGTRNYQSFTAVYTGFISKIALHATGPWGSSTLTIREGEGFSGTVLYTGTNNFTSSGWFETVVSVPVVAGRKYTVVLSNANGWSVSADNYAGGRSFDSSVDLGLRVWQQGYSTPSFAVQDDGVVTAAQLSLGGAATAVSGISTDGTLAGNSDASLPTEQAVKTYVDAKVAAVPGDNLGSHTATQPLNLNGQLLTGGGSAGLSISSAGNVGIGTSTAAAQKLEVSGRVKISGTGNGLIFPDNTQQTTAATDAQQLSKTGSTISLTNGGSVTDSDNQALSITGSTISLTNGGSVTVPSSADNLGNHTATQNLNLGTNQLVGNGGTAGLSISSAGAVTTAGALTTGGAITAGGNVNLGTNKLVGNGGSEGLSISSAGSVGIGTSSPAGRLHVNAPVLLAEVADQTQRATNATEVNSAARTQTFVAGLTGQLTRVELAWNNPAVGAVTVSLYEGAVASCNGGGTLLATASMTRANGWVSVSFPSGPMLTAGASYTLYVSNAQQLRLGNAASYPAGSYCAFSGAYDMAFGVYLKPASAVGYALLVDADGKLNVGSLGGNGAQMVVADNAGQLSTQALPVADNLGNHTATQNLGLNGNWLSNATGNSNGLQIDNAGKVTVGGTSPNEALEVQGQAHATGSLAGWLFEHRDDPTRQWVWYANGGAARLWSSASNADQLILKTNGDLGLGTTPTAKLDVNGSVKLGTNGSVLAAVIRTSIIDHNVGSMGANSSSDQTFTVNEARPGATVMVSVDGRMDGNIVIGTAWVSADNTVKVRLVNTRSISQTPGTASYFITVIQ